MSVIRATSGKHPVARLVVGFLHHSIRHKAYPPTRTFFSAILHGIQRFRQYKEDEIDLQAGKWISEVKPLAELERGPVPRNISYISPSDLSQDPDPGRISLEWSSQEDRAQYYYWGITRFASTTLFSALKPTYLSKMKEPMRHEGKCLLCRSIAQPNRDFGIVLRVEDTKGWASRVCIYHAPLPKMVTQQELKTILPINSVFAIREPFMHTALHEEWSQIRIDSPTDLVPVYPGDPILGEVMCPRL
ncbi:hypothetical protein CPB86DRAFT_785156 [Serendipita vermifera]|nr:hypothetical protein CPB86DRAFT_785156 [Serendipita vermifera]